MSWLKGKSKNNSSQTITINANASSNYVYTTPANTWAGNYTVMGVGAGGGGGYSSSYPSQSIITSAGQWTSISTTPTQASTVSISGQLKVAGNDPEISTDKYVINLNLLYENIQKINDRLNIIVADPSALNSNPSLKDAYDTYIALFDQAPSSAECRSAYEQYKLIEALSKELDKK